MKSEALDGELYLEPGDEPPVYRAKPNEGEFEIVVLENPDDVDKKMFGDNVFEKTLARWKDPTSPPHIKKTCSKWIKTGFPPIKICVGWTIQYRWIYRTAILRVSIPGQTDIEDIVHECLKASAVAAIIAGIASGGTGVIAAAEAALLACLKHKVVDADIGVSIRLASSRGDWE